MTLPPPKACQRIRKLFAQMGSSGKDAEVARDKLNQLLVEWSDLPAMAALSASGLSGLDVPRHVRDLIILADGDDAATAASRWRQDGRRVRIARPPRELDFDDILSVRVRRDGVA